MNYLEIRKFCPRTSGELTGFRWFRRSAPWRSVLCVNGYILFSIDTKSTVRRFQWVCGDLVTDW